MTEKLTRPGSTTSSRTSEGGSPNPVTKATSLVGGMLADRRPGRKASSSSHRADWDKAIGSFFFSVFLVVRTEGPADGTYCTQPRG